MPIKCKDLYRGLLWNVYTIYFCTFTGKFFVLFNFYIINKFFRSKVLMYLCISDINLLICFRVNRDSFDFVDRRWKNFVKSVCRSIFCVDFDNRRVRAYSHGNLLFTISSKKPIRFCNCKLDDHCTPVNNRILFNDSYISMEVFTLAPCIWFFAA